MRKVILSIIFFPISIASRAQAQSIIYDATAIMNAKYGVKALLVPTAIAYNVINSKTGKMEINVSSTSASLIQTNQSDEVIYEILCRNAGLAPGSSPSVIAAAYTSNPFLSNIIAETPPAVKAHIMERVDNFIAPAPTGSIGHDLLGNIVNGTADFLIKRAQEEISISVFQRLKTLMDRFPEFDKLFPKTCAMIKPVEVYEYNKALVAFKAAIQNDIKSFVGRLSSLYDIPRYQLLNEKVPGLTLLFSATTLLNELHGESNFASSIMTLSKQRFLNERNNYASFLKISTILSNSLLDKSLGDKEDKPTNYIHKEFIELVTHSKPALMAYLSKIYLGLIWQHTKDINFTNGITSSTCAQLLDHWASSANIENGIKIIDHTLAAIQGLDEKLKMLKDEESNAVLLTPETTFKAKRFVLYSEIIKEALDLTKIYIDPANTALSNRIGEISSAWPTFISSTAEMIKNCQAGEYNLAISNLEDILVVVNNYLDNTENDKTDSEALIVAFKAQLEAKKSSLKAQKEALKLKIDALPKNSTGDNEKDANINADRQTYEEAISNIENEIEDVDYQLKHKKLVLYSLRKVLRYTNLLAAITKAENSAAVEALLESYALPAGSSRLKKVSRFNFAVNSYVGGFFLRDGKEGEGFTNTYGLSAPIGFCISTGLNKGGSFSLFLGAFDIGGTIRYKLDNEGKYQQDISLAGVVSPSVHIVYGFPFYLPLSLGVGCQWISPTVSSSNKIELKSTFNAFLGVDIPLFNLAGVRRK